jgi:hypothetical protein
MASAPYAEKLSDGSGIQDSVAEHSALSPLTAAVLFVFSTGVPGERTCSLGWRLAFEMWEPTAKQTPRPHHPRHSSPRPPFP